ncbi:hypothetical protein GOBAR_AA29668 [Gossypium barbadense]|uniref:Uncharacterized protein n=1 Tax=Gossypium barbadense TaxID=3634 RepID=A0A2P5WIV3_GOSBA|nr:hypothetical protein GOBAR_AA29668 [Gossypium barbadense]
MPYYTSPAEDEPDEFDEHNPTPYRGGFDLFVTYGHPLEPSEETCYPSSTPSDGNFDYERPHFSSGSYPYGHDRHGHSKPYSSAHDDDGYGDQHGSHHHGRKPEHNSGYGRKSGHGEHGSEYGRKSSGYGDSESEYGSGYGKKQSHGSGRKSDDEDEGYKKSSYRKLSYDRSDEREEGYGGGRKSDDEDEGYKKSSYRRNDDNDSDDERRGHGRKKHVSYPIFITNLNNIDVLNSLDFNMVNIAG